MTVQQSSQIRDAESDNPGIVLYSQDQLAEMLGCSIRTLERQRLEGTGIPFIRLGRRRLIRYRLADVQQHLERHRQTSTSDTRQEEVRK